MMRAAILAAIFLCLAPSVVEARVQKIQPFDVAGYMGQSAGLTREKAVRKQAVATRRTSHSARREPEIRISAVVIGGRPSGCPHRYCGCGTSLKIFGRIRPELNLAANWIRKFPRTLPAPGMAAARSGHVMVLLEHVSGDKWKVWDANSGHGLTRVHVRSIRGFAVVNPGVSL